MLKKILSSMALCCATLAHAGWFDSYSDEVPPGIKVERAAGGTEAWQATGGTFTQSTFSREGVPLIAKDDGLHFKGQLVTTKASGDTSKVAIHSSTVCQKNNVLFYGTTKNLYQVNLDTGEPAKVIWQVEWRKEERQAKATIMYSPLTITNDCKRMVISMNYFPAKVAIRADTFHGGYDERFNTGKTDVFVGDLKDDGSWVFKRVFAADDKWLTHPQVEPVNGDRVILYFDGDANTTSRDACAVMNIDGSDLRRAANVASNMTTQLCVWIGDGKHILSRTRPTTPPYIQGYLLIDGYSGVTLKQVDLPFRGNQLSHEAAPKWLKNGNLGFVTDTYDHRIVWGEIDFKQGKLVRWAEIGKYGERIPKDNHLLAYDEGWYPHPNISQDKRFVGFTSQNGIGAKGSDAFVISGLPE